MSVRTYLMHSSKSSLLTPTVTTRTLGCFPNIILDGAIPMTYYHKFVAVKIQF